jgi:hypothetical protein
MHNRNLWVILLSFFAGYELQAQQVINGESFENTTFLPTGWQATSGSLTRWTRQTTSTLPTITAGAYGSAFARFSRSNPTTQTIALPVCDYRLRSGKNAYVRFYMYRDSLSKLGDSISVYVNTSNSLTGANHLGTVARYSRTAQPDTQIANGWYPYLFNIPATYTTATNYILIKGITANGNNIYLDSFRWNTFPLNCGGKPTGTSISSNPNIICGGTGSAVLTLSGATTTYGGITLSWQYSANGTSGWTATGGNAVTLNSGTITATRYYRCIVTCSFGGLTDTTAVTTLKVITTPNPKIVVSPANPTFCQGSPLLLMVATGAKTYTWSPTNYLTVANKDSVLCQPPNSVTYTITGIDSSGCTGTVNNTVSYRLKPTGGITSKDTFVCKGDSIQFVGNFGGANGIWTPGNLANSTIWAKLDTTYTLNLTSNFGCKSTYTRNLHHKLKSKAKFGYTRNGISYTFHDSSLNASAWHWLFGDGNESNRQNPVYTFSKDSLWPVKLIASNAPCPNDTTVIQINVAPVSVRHPTGQNLRMYPIPAKDKVNVQFPVDGTLQNIEVTDLTGRNVKIAAKQVSSSNLELTIEDIAVGIYILKVEFNGIHYSARFEKE